MADPLDAYKKEQNRRGLPLTRGEEIMGGIGSALESIQDVLPRGGMNPFTYYPMIMGQKTGENISEYLEGPSNVLEGLRSGEISESEIPLGVDLVDIFGETDPTLGAPDFLPDDYAPGEIFSYDPTGKGLTKGMPETRAEREAREAKAGLDAEIQAALDAQFDTVAAQKKKDAQRAEDFRAKEAKIAESQGGLQSMPLADSKNAAEQMFIAAMDDLIEGSRGAGPKKKEMTLDDYKKEFQEATGIDISGKPNKAAALMAAGAVLMNNKAGGKGWRGALAMLGEASEAALPKLEKAQADARAAALAAGKYALQTRATDRATDAANQEKLMNRGKYWVYKKGGKGEEFAAFDEGQFVDLNKFELNKLIQNPDFDKNYEFIDASDRLAILEKRAEGVDLGDQWATKVQDISLIGGSSENVPIALRVAGHPADPNYKGKTPTKYRLAESEEGVVRRFTQYQDDINRTSVRLTELLENIEKGISIPEQFVSSVVQAGRNLGFDMGGVSSVAQAKQELKNIAIDEALRILKESGRTISEGERERVEKRVGEIRAGSADPELLKNQLEYIYRMTVTNPQRDLDTAIAGFEENFGYSLAPNVSSPDMPQSQAELDALNKFAGTNFTMDDFKTK